MKFRIPSLAALAMCFIYICYAQGSMMLDRVGAEKPVIIAVMGSTGSGKSSFINSILGENYFKVGKDMESCTQNVDMVDVRIDGRLIRLIDTPGFDDSNLSDAEVLERIVFELGIQYKTETKFAGILYLRDITEFKMKGPDIKNLRMFKALCGTDGLEGVTLVTTKWNTMTNDMEIAERREEELKSKYFKAMFQIGATYARDFGTSKSSRNIIRKVLIKRKEFHVPFQREIMDEGKTLDEIEAGRMLKKELLEEREKHEQELKELRETIKMEHDVALRMLMEEQAERLEKMLKDRQADQQRLASQHAEEIKRIERETAESLEKLRLENEQALVKADEEHAEALRKQQEVIAEIQSQADAGDTSLLWTVAENVLKGSAMALGAHYAPVFVQGGMRLVGDAALKIGLEIFLPLMITYLTEASLRAARGPMINAPGYTMPAQYQPSDQMMIGPAGNAWGEADWLRFLGNGIGQGAINGVIDEAIGSDNSAFVDDEDKFGLGILVRYGLQAIMDPNVIDLGDVD